VGAGIAPDDDIVIEGNFVFRFTNVAAPFYPGCSFSQQSVAWSVRISRGARGFLMQVKRLPDWLR
jgi:hypothetical protein